MYTKGNWYLEEETGLILSIPDGSASPMIIAEVYSLKDVGANAHLIASAPLLYEALKDALALIGELTTREYHLAKPVFSKIEKALAKAGGK